MTRSRFLVLHFPTLPTDRLRRGEPSLRDQPLATWAALGNRRLLTAVDAPQTTLRAGQALADAQAMYPNLVLRPAEPEADCAFLESLALRALRYTPQVLPDPPDGLVLDIAGCTGPFGGEAPLLAHAVAGLERAGVAVQAVVADVAEAGAALARVGRRGLLVEHGQDRSLVKALPLSALRLSADCIAGLQRLGLHRIGDALCQPRAPLSRRFGRELLDALDAVTGDRPRSMVPIRPPNAFAAVEDYLDPIVTRPGIDLAVDRLLSRLCADLTGAERGARRLTLRAFRVDGDLQELEVGTGLPTRSLPHLRGLFAQVLERLEPDLGFERIALHAGETNALGAGQDGMASVADDPRRDGAGLSELLDRLQQRVSVWRYEPQESHWPERSVQAVNPFAAVPRTHALLGQEYPVRLLARPLPLMVVAAVPDGPPAQVRLDGAVHPVVWCDGPDCRDAEWWSEPDGRPGRDYWRVALGNGSRLWLGRAEAKLPGKPPRWFLHGYLA